MRHRKRPTLRAAAATLVAGLLLPAQAPAQGEGEDSPAGEDYAPQVVDAVLMRPLGAAATIIGFALFIPVAIITSPGGKDTIGQAWELFVEVPGEFAFTRKLGDF